MMNPIVPKAETFTFRSWSFDEQTGKAELVYAVDDERVVEQLTFPIPEGGIAQDVIEDVHRAMTLLHLVGGVSYYKAKLPRTIVVESTTLSKEQADFLNELYTKGLGEFFFRNKLDFVGYVNFPSGDVDLPHLADVHGEGALVPIGGGKDSLVTIELLREAGHDFDLFMFGNHARIREVALEVGGALCVVSRTIDPTLLAWNADGAYNGHVPITAYVSVAALIVGLLFGKRDVVFSNERSASVGNVMIDGVEINHQYSKSLDAERAMQHYIETFVTKRARVFSLLRPFSELDITRRFAGTGKYFGSFSSCNTNYRQGAPLLVTRWCGKCPKCAFVFVMLAAFLPRRRVVEMFGEDLLLKEDLLPLYKDLAGCGDMKPFECVGEFDEVRAAFALIDGRGEFDDSLIMRWFVDEILPTLPNIDEVITHALTPIDDNAMPEEYQKLVYASR